MKAFVIVFGIIAIVILNLLVNFIRMYGFFELLTYVFIGLSLISIMIFYAYVKREAAYG